MPVIAMHNQRGSPSGDLMADIVATLHTSLERADESGLGREQVIVDPGFGFGKTSAQNLEVLRRWDELKTLRKPILIGTSRQSMIGAALPATAPSERLEGTAATVAIGHRIRRRHGPRARATRHDASGAKGRRGRARIA